ncbi:MAG: glycoside hydrolase family 97 protein [Calditrichaeota bacterium]|nr:glycoside hydrolase family 97 protein [Calditrichota bacterium]
MAKEGFAVIENSPLSFKCQNDVSFEKDFYIKSVKKDEVNTSWKPVHGERSEIPDHYRSAVVELRQRGENGRIMKLEVRAYDEGIAFRYIFPEQNGLDSLVIEDENTTFYFTGDFLTWEAAHAQAEYQEKRLSELNPGCERPLTVKINDSLFVAIGEAALVDYARMKFDPIPGKPFGLKSSLASEVRSLLPFKTPWRFILIGKSAGELLEHNYLLLNLNEPCKIEDTSWIRPGKVIREITLTTAGGKACVDFAAKHNLQFVEFDAGWYGHEYDDSSDATTVTVDPKRSPGPLDLAEVVNYAHKKGVGIILYVNRRAMEKQLDEILPLYRKWGISGVKYGFVNVGSQYWTRWLHEAIRKAAENKLMVDIHDEYRPTGYSRTYPNLMTVEGIRGDEEAPTNEHTLITLFTRMIAGAGDNTNCYFSKRVDERMGSHASQLAKAVCLYSPWQFLYWYDSPPRRGLPAGNLEKVISETPELEFFDEVPTVWDDTKFLSGEIGKYATVARRSGENWFVGCVNGEEPRVFEVKLSFLKPGVKYAASIYSDDAAFPSRTHVRIQKMDVEKNHIIRRNVAANNGLAMMIVPVGE